jgi:branched-chain amino acid transport system substrate-binding protein
METATGAPSIVTRIKGVAPAETPFGVQSPFPAALAARGVAPVFSAATYDCTILTALAAVKAKSDDPVKLKAAFGANLHGQRDCTTFAACARLLDAHTSIHWRGASSNFDRFGSFEPGEGTYDVWYYDAGGNAVTSDPSAQIRVP